MKRPPRGSTARGSAATNVDGLSEGDTRWGSVLPVVVFPVLVVVIVIVIIVVVVIVPVVVVIIVIIVVVIVVVVVIIIVVVVVVELVLVLVLILFVEVFVFLVFLIVIVVVEVVVIVVLVVVVLVIVVVVVFVFLEVLVIAPSWTPRNEAASAPTVRSGSSVSPSSAPSRASEKMESSVDMVLSSGTRAVRLPRRAVPIPPGPDPSDPGSAFAAAWLVSGPCRGRRSPDATTTRQRPFVRIALAQIDTTAGDVRGNVDRVLAPHGARPRRSADLLVAPELVVAGYPPRDLLLRPGFVLAVEDATAALARDLPPGLAAVVGTVARDTRPFGPPLINAAAFLAEGEVRALYAKAPAADLRRVRRAPLLRARRHRWS
ncbi:MAG: hypothetical protein R3F05_17785 [Planctomycetota bacterium]